MLAGVEGESAESLWTAITTCAADPRPHKIDLLVGVYKNEAGCTPVMKAIRMAEARVLEQQETKNYLALTGRDAFSTAVLDLVLGKSGARQRAAGLQTVGGSGAIRILLEVVKRSNPDATVWLSDPGFAGHLATAKGADLRVRFYPYEVTLEGTLRAEIVLDTLTAAKKGDVVILDASCHNPTGVDLSTDVWLAVGELCTQQGVTPLVDVAYQGLGQDLVADVEGIAALTSVVDRAFVAVSCSKTFGVYRDRAGAAIVIGPTRAAIEKLMQSMVEASVALYAVPPDHGAALVEAVLNDASLRAMWQEELRSMNEHLRVLRRTLAAALEPSIGASGLQAIRDGRGIFSLLPLSIRQMRELRERFAIHGLQNGRVNITGINTSQVETLAAAMAAVLSRSRPS